VTAILSFPIGTALVAAAKLSGSFRLTAFLNLFDLMNFFAFHCQITAPELQLGTPVAHSRLTKNAQKS
jgi:hypothetical protein